MSSNKWSQAGQHLVSNLAGFSRFFLAHPGFALMLFLARARYFFTRQLRAPIATRDGFLIETTNELISYWSFFVERECLTREWVNALLAEGEPLVVDVGANAGVFSHLIWTLKPGVKLILFEPLPHMAKKIVRWGTATHAAYTLHEKAVSNFCGTTTFFASTENDTGASLIAATEKHLNYEVGVVTLDSVLPDSPILVLKIDVEGCECEVLSGAKRTLERARFLILEAHTKDALDRIKQTLPPEWAAKRIGASDYLFTKHPQRKN